MTVRIENKGRVWTVIHSRPEARNAMDPESAQALLQAFQRFDADPEAAAAVLWGEGGAFCAGFDLKYAATLKGGELEKLDRGPMGPTRLALDKPVIAAIAGPAVAGGFELALWCDVRVMEASAYFGVLRIGACEHVVPDGRSRAFAEAMAHEVARFPQGCLRADRRSVYLQQGLPLREAMQEEWRNGVPVLAAEAVEGARRFASGKGRHGDFGDI